MNLEDALGSSGGQPQWPGSQPGGQPQWPGGQPGGQPQWPGGQPAGQPQWPGGQPAGQPQWPGGQPAGQPQWPGGQPAGQSQWPGGQPGGQPQWPGGQPGGQPQWPGGNPSQPAWPGPPAQPSQPSAPGWPSPAPGPAAPQIVSVPCSQSLPNGVFDKLLITINGTIKPNADMFRLDMNTANDVAFHFNPRFNEGGKKVIVRNSMIGKKWGKEERELSHFPFVQGQPFELKILCNSSEFRVAVNKSHLLEFKHRIRDLRSITGFSVAGDLTLTSVKVETMP